MAERVAFDLVLRALVEAIEAREANDPDLPAWEAARQVRLAEAALLDAYRRGDLAPFDNAVASTSLAAAAMSLTSIELSSGSEVA